MKAERCTMFHCLCDPMPSTSAGGEDTPGTSDGEAIDGDDRSLSSGS